MVKFNELNENSSEEDGENRKIAKPRRARVFSSSDDDEPCPETVQVNAESSSTEVNTADTTSYNVDASGKKTGSEDEKPQAVKSRLILSSDTESDESDDENSRKSDHTTAVANFENDRMEATSPSNDVVPDEKEEKLKNEFFKTVKCPTLKSKLLTASDIESDSSDHEQYNDTPSNDVVQDEKEEKLRNETFKTVKYPTLKSKLITASDIESDGSDHEQFNDSNINGPDGVLPLSSDDSENENGEVHEPKSKEREQENKKKKKKKRPVKEVDPKLAIRSETQRMEREMPVNLPYHKPKQRSLREFLSRKKNEIRADSLRSTSHHMIRTW